MVSRSRGLQDKNWPGLVEILRDEGWSDEAIWDRRLDQGGRESPEPSTAHSVPPPRPVSATCRRQDDDFTAVIAKSADAGYRFFLVLWGIHDALRQQTQDRSQRAALGAPSRLWIRLTDETTSARPTRGRASGGREPACAGHGEEERGPAARASKWLAAPGRGDLDRCPILIIDDEADQASRQRCEARPQPPTINRLVRDIVNMLRSCLRRIHGDAIRQRPDRPERRRRPLPARLHRRPPASEVYIGPEAIFGREALEFDAGTEADDGGAFVREVP